MSTPPAAQPGSPWPTAPPGEAACGSGSPKCASCPHMATGSAMFAMVALLLAGLALLTAILVVVAVLAPPPPPAPCPPLRCQAPPIGDIGTESVQGSRRPRKGGLQEPPGFHRSVLPVPGHHDLPGVATTANSITLSFPFKASYGGTSYLTVIGQPDGGATPQQIVDDESVRSRRTPSWSSLMPHPYVGTGPATARHS